MEYWRYLSVITTSQRKINIAKTRMNSHELHTKTGRWYIPKTLWVAKVFHMCQSMSIEDENHFLLECLSYTHMRSEFHSICYNTNIYNFLACQNYSKLGKLLGKRFEHRNNIFKVNQVFYFLWSNIQNLVSVDINHHHLIL